MNLGIIIQARTGSSRLPNKVILPFYYDKTILDILLENLSVFREKYPIILATSTDKNDDILEGYSKKNGYYFFRGSENNVLNRFIEASNKYQIDYIIRVCADNPFFDVGSLNNLISILMENQNLDYCSFENSHKTPVIKTHTGIFGEIVSKKALEKAIKMTDKKEYLEHVTNFIYSNPDIFKIYLEKAPDNVFYRDDLRFTVDDKIDFENMRIIYNNVIANKNWSIQSVIDFVDSNKQIKNYMIGNIKKYSK